jgi:single-strand DNA-binding protein
MNSFNELKIIGNLAVDPELTYTQGGTALCKFNVAVNKKVKEEEKVFFLSCEVWKESAEIFDKYVKKVIEYFLTENLQ